MRRSTILIFLLYQTGKPNVSLTTQLLGYLEVFPIDSILITIKKMLGIDPDYDVFDPEICVFINSAFMKLEQLGLGTSGFHITGKDEIWDDAITDIYKFESVKTFIYLTVRLAFDPPSNSSLYKAFEEMIKELEWRLNVKAEQEGGD